MEKEMKELYGEGLATHTDPESCAGSRKGTGEALTGAHAGRAIEPRKHQVLGADAVTASGRQHDLGQHCEHEIDLARSENSEGGRSDGVACVESMRENREVPCPPAADGAAGRDGKAKAVIRR
jgi:hypothetical protein